MRSSDYDQTNEPSIAEIAKSLDRSGVPDLLGMRMDDAAIRTVFRDEDRLGRKLERHEAVARQIAHPTCRQVYQMRAIERMSFSEIAEAVGWTAGRVRATFDRLFAEGLAQSAEAPAE